MALQAICSLHSHQPEEPVSQYHWGFCSGSQQPIFSETRKRHEYCKWVSQICPPSHSPRWGLHDGKYDLHQVSGWPVWTLSTLNAHVSFFAYTQLCIYKKMKCLYIFYSCTHTHIHWQTTYYAIFALFWFRYWPKHLLLYRIVPWLRRDLRSVVCSFCIHWILSLFLHFLHWSELYIIYFPFWNIQYYCSIYYRMPCVFLVFLLFFPFLIALCKIMKNIKKSITPYDVILCHCHCTNSRMQYYANVPAILLLTLQAV